MEHICEKKVLLYLVLMCVQIQSQPMYAFSPILEYKIAFVVFGKENVVNLRNIQR